MAKQDEAKLICSFCGKSRREVRKLIAGPTIYICDECIKLCNDILAAKAERKELPPDRPASRATDQPDTNKSSQLLCCSFCGKSQRDVTSMIAGPSSYICDECIGLCNDIIVEEINREDHASVLTAKLPKGVHALIAGILERGMPAAVRIRGVLGDRIIEDMAQRRAGGEPPDELIFLPMDLVAEWWGLHEILARATPEESESGDLRPLVAQLPEWVNAITERFAGTLEALDVLARSLEEPGLEKARQLIPSVSIALKKLFEAREMLLAGAPRSPEGSP